MRSRIFLFLITFASCFMSMFANTNDRISEIEIRQIIIDGCDAISSSSYEEEDIKKIELLCDIFESNAARELVNLKRNRVCDRGDELSMNSLWEIEECIDKVYPMSYSVAYVRLLWAVTTHVELVRKEGALMAYEHAKRITASADDIAVEELQLVSELVKIANATYIYGPTQYEQFRRLQCRINCFYEKHNIHSKLRQISIAESVNYLERVGGYSAYIEHVEHCLKQENIQGYNKLDMMSLLKDEENESLNRHQEHHPDILEVKADICMYQLQKAQDSEEADALLEKLCSLKEEVVDYFGPNHHSPLYLNFIYDISCGKYQNKTLDESFFVGLEDLCYYYGEEAFEQKVHALSNALQATINTHPDKADSLFSEINDLATELWLDPVASFNAMCNVLYLQRVGVAGVENALEELRELKSELFVNEHNWQSLNASALLFSCAQKLFGNSQTVINLYDEFIEELNIVEGKDSPLAILCGINYLDAKIGSVELYSEKEKLEEVIENYTREAENLGLDVAPFHLAHAMLRKEVSGDTTFADYFIKALQSIDSYYLDSEEEALPLKTNVYVCWLASILDKHIDVEHMGECVAFLTPIVEAELQSLKHENMFTYLSMAKYYLYKEDVQSAARIGEACVQYYQNNSFLIDNSYILFVQILANIYFTGYGDMENMEKIRHLLVRLQTDAERVKAFLGYNEYLLILRLCYDLLETKLPNDILTMSYLNDYIITVAEYINAEDDTDGIIWSHAPYYLMKLSNVVRNVSLMRKANPYTMPDMQWNAMIENCRALLEDFDIEGILERMPDLKLTANYYLWLGAMSQLHEFGFEDLDEARLCLEKLKESNEYDGLIGYMLFYIRNNKWEEARELADKMYPLLNEKVERGRAMGSISTLSDPVSMLFNIYYSTGDYEKALELVNLYVEMRTEYIQRNFDYFTTQERESFFTQGGTGGGGFYSLLPKLKDKVSPHAYDAALREKGLLLRSSERLKNAILDSGNEELIASSDSIRFLTQQLLAITDVSDLDEMQKAVSLRREIERLERYVNTITADDAENQEVLSWTQVRDALNKDEVAIEFVAGESTLSALVLRKGFKKPKYVHLLNMEDGARIMSYMTDPVNYTENMKRLYEEDGRWLYDKIWKPLLPTLGDAKRVFYSPTNMLNALSFAAFKCPDGTYLIDNYDLRQLSTTANVVHRNNTAKSNQQNSAVLLGGLCYEDIQLEFMDQDIEDAKQSVNDVVRQREPLESFQFLPFSYIEQESICTTFRQNNILVTPYTGMDADEETVREQLRQAPEILHISTHGFSYTDPQQAMNIPFIRNRGQMTPLNCAGIALSDANPVWEGEPAPAEADNILTADEIAAFDLRNTKLAVLSACNTALGVSSNEGVMGLQRGLKLAGVASLCLSLWSVNDVSSSSLMSEFYNCWLGKNMAMNESMNSAMKKVRETYSSPYFWAPFVLIDAFD